MKYAVIDTENTGLFNYREPANAEGQPRLASLAAIALNEDLTVESEGQWFVRPDGWKMPAAATEIHGLTTEHLLEVGQPVQKVLEHYTDLIERGYVIAAWNAQHDLKQLRAELRRADLPDRFEETPNTCLMRASTDICCIPHPTRRGFKFPKLQEACDHFGVELADAHTALGDCKAATEILRILHARDALIPPKVHYAKNPPSKPEAA